MERKALDGYPTFAKFIAKDPDAAIYRKFECLSARNLLYQQSQLNDLERQLEELDSKDAIEKAVDINNEAGERVARDWQHFVHDDNERAKLRRELQDRIKKCIKEYHEALILESQVLALNAPAPRTLATTRRWYTLKGTPVLWGRDQSLFEQPRDLVALAPVDTDRLNIFLKSYVGWLFQTEQTGDLQNRMYYFPERRIQLLGTIISILLSSLILIGAIVFLLLASKRSIELQVGVIVIFTFLFAAVVGLLTNARRAEIFGSSAAYAAVLVVFVSNLR